MSLLSDAKNIRSKDPAARSLAEVLLLYPGFHALIFIGLAIGCISTSGFFLPVW